MLVEHFVTAVRKAMDTDTKADQPEGNPIVASLPLKLSGHNIQAPSGTSLGGSLVSLTEMTFTLPQLLDLKPSDRCAPVAPEVAHVEDCSEVLQADPLPGGSVQTFIHLPVNPLL